MKELSPFVKKTVITPAIFRRPWFVAEPLAWAPHIPFAFWIIETVKPRVLVELGTHIGNSFFTFCQCIKELELNTVAYAVDTWQGDEHAGRFGEEVFRRVQSITSQHFALFARLIRSLFDEALPYFNDGSVDLLHIDGYHTYEAVKHDFESWLPKMSGRGVVLLHDINVKENNFGVWRFWNELTGRYPHMSFIHGHGLGVVLVGSDVCETLCNVCEVGSNDQQTLNCIRDIFDYLGSSLSDAREREIILSGLSRTGAAGSPESEISPDKLSQGMEGGNSIPAAIRSDLRRIGANNELLFPLAMNAVTARMSAIEAEKAALGEEAQKNTEEVRYLRRMLATKDFFASMLSSRLEVESRRSLELSDRCTAYVDQLNAWSQAVAGPAALIQRSFSWRFMRMMRRAGALIIRGEDEGRIGFIRWVFSKVTGRPYGLRRSYDPFMDNSILPSSEIASQKREAAISVVPPEPYVLREAPKPPEILHLGKENASGLIDCVIPVKGSVNWLALALKFLVTNTAPELLRNIFIVDDGSSESEMAVIMRLAQEFEIVTIIQNIGPKGFAGACNAGASSSSAAYILFLNSDCLVTRNSLSSMVAACEADDSVGIVTALSNNAATISVAIPSGWSFQQVDDLLHEVAGGMQKRSESFVEACTVVGHCLLVTRQCFIAVGGFNPEWGLGYGEETDLQMRARSKGYRGVVALDTYVYHFGGGTFKYEDNVEQLRTENHAKFLRIWGKEYQKLLASSSTADPVRIAGGVISKAAERGRRPDVLFIIPGFTHSVGGILVPTDICNHLMMADIDAKLLILGDYDPELMRTYPEALFSSPIHVRNQAELLASGPSLVPKVVVSTLFTTCFPARRFAAACDAAFINFVQGYEFYFDNGIHYSQVRESYQTSDVCIATSKWLAAGIKRHSPNSDVYLLPLGVDPFTHFPAAREKGSNEKVRIAVVLRSQPDKGQWILREVLERLSEYESDVALSIFACADVLPDLNVIWSSSPDTVRVALPLDRYKMSAYFRECDLIVDSSLHEGFGLVPIEAMASGCAVIASDSGGIREYLRHEYNGLIIEAGTNPERYIGAIIRLVADRSLLSELRRNARATAKDNSWVRSFERYKVFFEAAIRGDFKSCSELQYSVGPEDRNCKQVQQCIRSA